MTHGSLFSGIGGFDLAAQWAGFENIFQVEIDNYCQKVLAKNFPNVKRYKDIKEFDGTEYAGAIDIISGGFPCQPFSVAGKQKGAEDDRNLWPEMFRIIQEIRPTWVLGENVANIINFVEFDNILSDLEAAEYEVQPLIIPAVAKDARHRRDRVWIVAYTNNSGSRTSRGRIDRNGQTEKQKQGNEPQPESCGCGETMAHTNSNGTKRDKPEHRQGAGIEQDGKAVAYTERQRQQGQGEYINTSNSQTDREGETGKPFDVCFGCEWKPEPAVGRVANGIPRRVDRLKGLGNAIVPQVAYTIFQVISELERAEG